MEDRLALPAAYESALEVGEQSRPMRVSVTRTPDTALHVRPYAADHWTGEHGQVRCCVWVLCLHSSSAFCDR